MLATDFSGTEIVKRPQSRIEKDVKGKDDLSDESELIEINQNPCISSPSMARSKSRISKAVKIDTEHSETLQKGKVRLVILLKKILTYF